MDSDKCDSIQRFWHDFLRCIIMVVYEIFFFIFQVNLRNKEIVAHITHLSPINYIITHMTMHFFLIFEICKYQGHPYTILTCLSVVRISLFYNIFLQYYFGTLFLYFWDLLEKWKKKESQRQPLQYLHVRISEFFDTVAFVRILWCSCRMTDRPSMEFYCLLSLCTRVLLYSDWVPQCHRLYRFWSISILLRIWVKYLCSKIFKRVCNINAIKFKMTLKGRKVDILFGSQFPNIKWQKFQNPYSLWILLSWLPLSTELLCDIFLLRWRKIRTFRNL